MTSISKNSAITFLSKITIFVFELISIIILARILGPKGKGIYALIILISDVMLRIGSLGLEIANIYFIGKKVYKINDIVSISFFSAIFLGFMTFIFFGGVYNFDFFKNFLYSNHINPFYLWLVVFTIPLSLLFKFLINIVLGKEDIVNYNIICIINKLFYLITIIIFLLILKLGIFGAVLSYVSTIVLTAFFIIFSIKKIAPIFISFNKKIFKELLKYGLKAYVGNMVQFLNYRLDMLLVAIFLTPSEVGFYSIAVGIAERFWLIPESIATVLFPRISSSTSLDANQITPKIARHTLLIIFILSLLLTATANLLIKILFGQDFLPSIAPLLILLPGIIFFSVSKILTADLAGRGKPQFGTYAAFISLAVNVPLNLLLIPRWGISGAAFASSVAYILATVIAFIYYIKISANTLTDILLIKRQDFQAYSNLMVTFKDLLRLRFF